jgi:hypothetical protein
MKSLIVLPLTLLATAGAATAQSSFTGLSHEIVAYPELDGAVRAVVRLYAEYSNPSESVYIAYTVAGGAATVLETSDPQGFWQAPFGGDTSMGIQPAIVALYPETGYDSYVTIGAPDAGGGNGLTDIGIDWTAWNNGGPLQWIDGAWFQIPDTTFTYPVSGRVLLAQLTVTAGETISGRFSLDSRTAPGVSYSNTDVPFVVETDAQGVPFCTEESNPGACPCGNAGSGASGCANSSGIGASLASSGSVSVAADSLTLDSAGLLPGKASLLFAGTSQVNGGSGALFGDGLRCAGGQIRRLGVRIPGAGGTAQWSGGIATALGVTGGETRHFQVWYRDLATSPCGNAFNLSGALSLTFTP